MKTLITLNHQNKDHLQTIKLNKMIKTKQHKSLKMINFAHIDILVFTRAKVLN